MPGTQAENIIAVGRPRAGSDLPVPRAMNAIDARPGNAPADRKDETPSIVFVAVTAIVGVGSGAAGMMLAMVLHQVQHLAYGYSLGYVTGPQSFLMGVTQAPPWRRVLAMSLGGLVAGAGWWAVYGYGRPLVSIRQAVRSGEASMPLATIGHAILQIVTVGLGSPLGREVAPREVGALLASWLSKMACLDERDRRVMVACGAGAGLAAVYDVPLAGAVFALEVLLGRFDLRAAAPAMATSAIAAIVAWAGLGNEVQYRLPHSDLSASLVCWSLLAGPVFGIAGDAYTRVATLARARAPRQHKLVPWCLGVFASVGVAAIWYPQLLGNGKGPLQLGIDGDVGIRLAVALLATKLIATTACLRAGAEGGMLTPGMAIGGLLAIVLAEPWLALWSGSALGAFVLVGATGFLSSSMAMPLTAIALAMEFTRMDHDMLFPVMLCVAGAVATRRALSR